MIVSFSSYSQRKEIVQHLLVVTLFSASLISIFLKNTAKAHKSTFTFTVSGCLTTT